MGRALAYNGSGYRGWLSAASAPIPGVGSAASCGRLPNSKTARELPTFSWRRARKRNAPSADRIVCRGRAGERVAPPRASVSDGRQPTERDIEAAATGGPATSQGGVWIRITSSGRADEPGPAHGPFCQFGLARLVSAGRRADAARLERRREGPLGPTSAGPTAAAAPCWGTRHQPKASASGARPLGGAWPPTIYTAPETLPSGGRLTGPQDCEAAHHAWWRRARNRRVEGSVFFRFRS
jgi:hypothetical protein